jgi:alpha-N-acetylglucosamine transferase
MGDVLQKSIRLACPTAKIIYHKCEAPKVNEEERELKRFGENAEKLRIWVNLLEKCEDNEIVLIDSDVMVLQDISEVFLFDFDIGCTRRTRNQRIIYNGGVMFVKKNERSLEFFRKFREIDDQMLEDKNFHEIWRAKYAGMNQAAFGWMVENYTGNFILREFPCAVYNSLSDDWKTFDPAITKIVHLKGPLRDVILDKRKNKYQNIKKIFDDIEAMNI